MRALKITLIFVLILCLLAGCAGSPGPAPSSEPGSEPSTAPAPTQGPALDCRLPEIDENYFELLADTHAVIHTSDGLFSAMTMVLHSAHKLTDEDIRLTTDQGKEVRVLIVSEWKDEFDEHMFLNYQTFDWAACAEVWNDELAAEKLLAPYRETFQQVELPPLYFYQLSVSWYDMFPECRVDDTTWALPEGMDMVQIKELTITVKGQSKTYPLRQLCFTDQKLGPQSSALYGAAFAGGELTSYEPGQFISPSLKYYVNADVTLTGFSFPDFPDNQALSCKLKIIPPKGPFIEMKWDCKTPVEVDAGSKIEAELTFSAPELADVQGGCGLIYFTLHFETAEGQFIAPLGGFYAIDKSPFEYYAEKYDGVDVMSYYRDFKSHLSGQQDETDAEE